MPEDRIVDPYDETLANKSTQERRLWGEQVLKQLKQSFDLVHDEFIFLASKTYYEALLPHLHHFWLPLVGKTQGQWIPELRRLIELEREPDRSKALHMLFNGLPRLDWTMINDIPYKNGIYVMFEAGESFHGMDRIVRVGTHRGENRLLKRLKDHFMGDNAHRSILRKNIGRAFLHRGSAPYLRVREIDMQYSANRRKYGHLVDDDMETNLEARISRYLRENITFICFLVSG